MTDDNGKITRCGWVTTDPLYIEYHDKEWGTPVHDDIKLFEFLILEGAQAGLNWLTILKKRQNFVQAFDGFNPEKIANYNEKKIAELLSNKGIIRNRLKIHASVKNAQGFLAVREEFGSFNNYIWQFTSGKTIINRFKTDDEVPAQTPASLAMSKDLKSRGFSFVGPTICYALMQATGMVNDHLVSCFRHRELSQDS